MTALDDYGPYDAGVGANRTEDFWRDFMRHLTGSGVIAGVTNEFAVTQHSGGDQTVDVATGECFIRGQWGESTSLKNIALSAAHATLARIDRIVLRNDFTANTISIEVLEGTAAATPTIPALTQSSSRWEEGLARIARAANDNVVGTADITDERTFLTFAGITGLPIKPTVRAASITNVTLASACEAGDTFGGVTLAYGDRIGLFGQTTASECGLYVVNQTGAPTRAPDADTSAKLKPNTLVGVSEGTLADKWYQLTTNAPIVLGTTAQVWAEFGAAAASTSGLTLIEERLLAVDMAALTFASIATTWRSLMVVFAARSSVAGASDRVLLRFNADSGANYDLERARQLDTVTDALPSLAQNGAIIARIAGNTATAGRVGGSTIIVRDYKGTTFNKAFHAVGNWVDGTASTNVGIENWAGLWRSTAAISSITLTPESGPNFLAGSVFSLYGMA